jgi:hypothetical protein
MAKEQSDSSHKADHLKPHQWKPGETGNPHGRPKGPDLLACLRKALEMGAKDHPLCVELYKNLGEDPNGKTVADAFVAAGIISGMKGNSKMWKEIFERICGKVAQPVEHDVSEKLERLMVSMHDEPPTLEGSAKLIEGGDDGE